MVYSLGVFKDFNNNVEKNSVDGFLKKSLIIAWVRILADITARGVSIKLFRAMQRGMMVLAGQWPLQQLKTLIRSLTQYLYVAAQTCKEN